MIKPSKFRIFVSIYYDLVKQSDRSCQLSEWRTGVDAALHEGLTPLLLYTDTLYHEIKTLLLTDSSVHVLDVKPLSPSGIRTKVKMSLRFDIIQVFELCFLAGKISRLYGTMQVKSRDGMFTMQCWAPCQS